MLCHYNYLFDFAIILVCFYHSVLSLFTPTTMKPKAHKAALRLLG